MTDLEAIDGAHTIGLPLPDGVWSVDARRSEIGFAVKAMWGLATVRGVFGAYEGSLEVRAGGATGELSIEAGSLDTGNKRRDRHLRSPDFFDTERHPRVVFTATGATAGDGGPVLTGELVVGASRIPLQVPVNVADADDGGLRVDGETRVSREQAGMTWNWLATIRGDAVLHARLTLARAGS